MTVIIFYYFKYTVCWSQRSGDIKFITIIITVITDILGMIFL